MIREEAASGASGRIVPEGLEMLRRDGTAIRFEVDGNTLFARSPGVDTALLEGVESAVFWYEDGGKFIGAEIVVRDRGASAPRTLHARIPTQSGENDRLARTAQRRCKPR